jgi:predicted MFS family arabinose efflux permease
MEGFRYAARHTAIAPLFVILISTYILARPFVDLLAGFSDNVFGQGAAGLAWLTAMVGIGALAGSAALASQSNLVGLTKRMIRMLLLLILSVLGFTATDNFVLALLFAMAAGYCIVGVGVTEQTLLQAAVDDAMRGRVMSFYTLIARGCPAIGALCMGLFATYFGLRLPVALGAASCLGIWYWAYRRQSQLASTLERTKNFQSRNLST